MVRMDLACVLAAYWDQTTTPSPLESSALNLNCKYYSVKTLI